MYRSQTTSAPPSSAGRITRAASSARAAAKSAASAQAVSSVPCSRSSRTRSPKSVPPGSRVATTFRPSVTSASRRRSAWVDLPEPSRPSKVTNMSGLGRRLGGADHQEVRASPVRPSETTGRADEGHEHERLRISLVRAIVTGGAGFIGSHVADALVARGDDVHVLDNLATGRRENVPEGAELVDRDVREPLEELFDATRPEVCFHLAAQADVRVSVERPDYDADVNVLGTIRVLEASRRHGTQVVFSSTGGAIYGECDGPAPETAPLRPLSPYGAAKLAGEEYLATYNRLYGSGHVSLRYGNVYGPRQD